MSDHLENLCRVLARLAPQPDTAAQVHVAAAKALRRSGFDVILEYGLDHGRIDIVAVAQDGWRCAIEIDARKPRARSLVKLRAFLGAKVVALRGVGALIPDGIDATVLIPVRMATQAERDDRRTVSRMD